MPVILAIFTSINRSLTWNIRFYLKHFVFSTSEKPYSNLSAIPNSLECFVFAQSWQTTLKPKMKLNTLMKNLAVLWENSKTGILSQSFSYIEKKNIILNYRRVMLPWFLFLFLCFTETTSSISIATIEPVCLFTKAISHSGKFKHYSMLVQIWRLPWILAILRFGHFDLIAAGNCELCIMLWLNSLYLQCDIVKLLRLNLFGNLLAVVKPFFKLFIL